MPGRYVDTDRSESPGEAQGGQAPTATGSAEAAVVTVAYMAYWSFLITCLVYPVASQAEVGAALTIVPALCGLASFTATQWVATRFNVLVGGKRSWGPLLAFALCSAPLLAAMILVAFGMQAGLWTQAAAWALWGVGQAALFPLLGSMQTRTDEMLGSRKAMPLLVSGAFVGAGLLCLLALLVPDPVRSFLPALYGACALAALVVGRQLGLARDLPAIEGLSDDFKPLASLKILSPLIVNSSTSLLACYCIAHYDMATTLTVVALGCMIGGGTFLLSIAASRHSVVNARIERWVFPLTALCFFALVLLPDPWRLGAAVAGIALYFIYAAFHWSIQIALARRFKITSPLHFATGLLAPGAGFCIGWLIAAVFALAGGDLAQPYLLFFGWTVAYVIVLSVAPYASDPLFEIDLFAPEKRTASPEDRSGNSWERACEAIAESCGLSPREREVFSLLAHGRNAEYISNALFISGNTAKTHKYRIYRKLGVNTHQELLDKVEAVESEQLNDLG